MARWGSGLLNSDRPLIRVASFRERNAGRSNPRKSGGGPMSAAPGVVFFASLRGDSFMNARFSARVSCMAAVVSITTMGAASAMPRTATHPASIKVPPGFRVELLRSAQDGEDSWISMSFDPKGRIVIGLDAVGVARLSPPGDASGAGQGDE